MEELWVYYYIILTVIGYLLDLELTNFMLGTFDSCSETEHGKPPPNQKPELELQTLLSIHTAEKSVKIVFLVRFTATLNRTSNFPNLEFVLQDRPSEPPKPGLYLPSLVTTFTFLA